MFRRQRVSAWPPVAIPFIESRSKKAESERSIARSHGRAMEGACGGRGRGGGGEAPRLLSPLPRTLATLLLFSSLLLALFESSFSSSSPEIRILSAERRVENIGTSHASEVVLAFPPTQVKNIALIQASTAEGKRKKKTYAPLAINPTMLPGTPNNAQLFSISLINPLKTGETAVLEVLLILTHSLEPFPAEINQSESQFVYYRDSAVMLSPYHIKEQITYIKTPSTKIESYSRVDPTNRVGTELRYGHYDDRPPYSFSPILVHFENNNPFAVVEELTRVVEVSHWGSLQVREHYKLVHAGARHKGIFSRLEYQSRASISGVSSFRHLLATLPPRVHSVFYRDEIGNISTSHLRSDSQKSELEIEPRYPLFGGWRATFVVGYGLPLNDFLFESPDGRRYLNFSFGCPLMETVVDKLIIKVYYSFSPVFMLAEPLMLAAAFFLFFIACIAYLHIDLSIRKS